MRFFTLAGFGVWTALVAGCAVDDPDGSLRASGFVEATDVRVASKIGGRLETVTAVEGARVTAGDVLVQIATTDLDLVLRRVSAERAQASAVLQLLEAGAREEDIRRAEAQVASARADRQAAQAELDAAASQSSSASGQMSDSAAPAHSPSEMQTLNSPGYDPNPGGTNLS